MAAEDRGQTSLAGRSFGISLPVKKEKLVGQSHDRCQKISFSLETNEFELILARAGAISFGRKPSLLDLWQFCFRLGLFG